MSHSTLTRKLLPAAAAVVFLGLLATAVVGQDDGSGTAAPGLAADDAHHGGFPHALVMQRMHGMMKSLNLSDEQKASVKQLFQEMKTQAAPIWEAQRGLHQQFRAALEAPSPDAAAIGQLAIQMHQGRQQMKPLMESFDKKFQALLTPDQLTKYQALRQAHPFGHHLAPPAPQ